MLRSPPFFHNDQNLALHKKSSLLVSVSSAASFNCKASETIIYNAIIFPIRVIIERDAARSHDSFEIVVDEVVYYSILKRVSVLCICCSYKTKSSGTRQIGCVNLKFERRSIILQLEASESRPFRTRISYLTFWFKPITISPYVNNSQISHLSALRNRIRSRELKRKPYSGIILNVYSSNPIIFLGELRLTHVICIF